MTDETIAGNMAPAAFSNVVDAVKSSLTTGDAGVRMAGVGLDGGALQKSVADAVENALSISVLDALLKGWHGVKSVTALTGRDGPMDGKARVAALAKHKLKVTHTPEIRVSIGEVADLRTVALPVTLEVEASGVVLTVVDRQVTKASAGTLAPKLTVKVEKVKVVETKLRQIELSGNLLSRMPEDELESSA